MRLLILGGTWYLGRTVAEQAIAAGWQVTTFSRGRSGHDVPGAVPVRGRREDADDITRLAGAGRWDVVVDTSAYTPEAVDLAAWSLKDRAGRYMLISTVNAYRGWPTEPLTDGSQVYGVTGASSSPVPTAAEVLAPSGISYGQGKAAGERALVRWFGAHNSLVMRPGVILGPYEYVGRLPWLLRRMQRGGEILAAGSPGRLIQPVDVRDLSEFILHAATTGLSGAMNVTAPLGPATYGSLLESCLDVTGGHGELVWVADDWLASQDVTPWSEIPLWRTTAGAWHVLSERAWSSGLSCRPLRDTVTDTWNWLRQEEPVPHERAAEIGLDPAKEERLLAAWGEHAHRGDSGG